VIGHISGGHYSLHLCMWADVSPVIQTEAVEEKDSEQTGSILL
jgi:hypothetical protein